jgi:hypothetical protein
MDSRVGWSPELSPSRRELSLARTRGGRAACATIVVFGVLTLAAVVAACSTSANDPNGQGGPGSPGLVDDSGVAPAVKVTDGSADGADATSGCDELGSLKANNLTASYDTDSRWFTGAVPGRPSLTELTVLGVGSPSSLQGNIVALGTGLNANYATCTHCMMVLAGCTATDCTGAKKFFAELGSAYFNQVSSGPGEPFAGQFADVTLREVTLDANYTSTDVPNGACLHLTSFTFSALTPANATDGGDSSDGANTTGGGGRGVGSSGTSGPPPLDRDGDSGTTPGSDSGSDGGQCSVQLCKASNPCCDPLSCVIKGGAQFGLCE